MQGLSLDSSLMPSLATGRVPVATLTNPADYGFDSHNVWDVPGVLLQDAIGSLGGLADPGRPVPDQGEPDDRPGRPLRRQLGRFVGDDGQAHYQHEGEYPETDFGRRLAGLAALLHAGFPIRAVALAGAGLLRHALRRAGRRSQTERRRSPTASPRSSTTSSAAARRPRWSRCSGASSGAAPSRTTRTAPTTAPPASAS